MAGSRRLSIETWWSAGEGDRRSLGMCNFLNIRLSRLSLRISDAIMSRRRLGVDRIIRYICAVAENTIRVKQVNAMSDKKK
jgi:hypothetical protein